MSEKISLDSSANIYIYICTVRIIYDTLSES